MPWRLLMELVIVFQGLSSMIQDFVKTALNHALLVKISAKIPALPAQMDST
jgi:hypothetical protein